jgi:hypothetical protein
MWQSHWPNEESAQRGGQAMRNASGLRQMVSGVGFPAHRSQGLRLQFDAGLVRTLCQPASANGIAPIQARRIDSIKNHVKQNGVGK